MKYEFYLLERFGSPMVRTDPELEYLADLLHFDTGKASKARGVLSAIKKLQAGDLQTFTWGGNSAHAEFGSEGVVEISHDSFDNPPSIEVSLNDFEKILSEWLAFLEEQEGIENAKPDRLSQKLIQLHEQRSRNSSDKSIS